MSVESRVCRVELQNLGTLGRGLSHRLRHVRLQIVSGQEEPRIYLWPFRPRNTRTEREKNTNSREARCGTPWTKRKRGLRA